MKNPVVVCFDNEHVRNKFGILLNLTPTAALNGRICLTSLNDEKALNVFIWTKSNLPTFVFKEKKRNNLEIKTEIGLKVCEFCSTKNEFQDFLFKLR